jgi:signal transduction histidine kinase
MREPNGGDAEFLAMVSHEIRTPLNGIVGFARLLAEAPMRDAEQDCVRIILTCAEEMLCLLEDISDLSGMEAGGFKIEPRPFAIRSVVDEVCELFSLQARQKGIALETNIAPDVPETLVGDAGRLRQVLLNLTGNAIKFTEKGHVAIAVSRDSPILFCVKDSGTGISSEMLKTIFNPFTCCHKNGGRGLGLAISKRLVELMGGSLRVETHPGFGSCFFFRLPLEPIRE